MQPKPYRPPPYEAHERTRQILDSKNSPFPFEGSLPTQDLSPRDLRQLTGQTRVGELRPSHHSIATRSGWDDRPNHRPLGCPEMTV